MRKPNDQPKPSPQKRKHSSCHWTSTVLVVYRLVINVKAQWPPCAQKNKNKKQTQTKKKTGQPLLDFCSSACIMICNQCKSPGDPLMSPKKQGGSGTTSLSWTYIKVCGYSNCFCKNLNQRSLTPRWPLTPHLLRSVWLYPRIIVSKSHENTSKYVDTVTFLQKNWSKGHWLLDDLWPHICWGHMCDSTQGSLCPSPMKIHQSMWIQWPFLQKLEPKVIDPRWPLTPHLLRS